MFWSKLFIPTLRANPAGESPGRQLLQRAGYLRGADRWLFLAGRSLRKIVEIAREEFDAAGAQEMLLPDSGAFEDIAREIRSYKQLPQIWYRFGAGPNVRAFGANLDARAFDANFDTRAFGVEPVALDGLCRRVLHRCGVPYAATENSFAAWS